MGPLRPCASRSNEQQLGAHGAPYNDKAAHGAALSFNGGAYFSTKARSIR